MGIDLGKFEILGKVYKMILKPAMIYGLDRRWNCRWLG